MYRKDIQEKAIPYMRRKRNSSIWRKIVQVMACFVVFCTTYALILPAITVQQEYFCGKEAHQHGEECYIQESVTEFLCVSEQRMFHYHDDFCYDEQNELICTLPELEEHIHQEEDCYEVVDGHSHDDDCYDAEGLLLCSKEESPEVLELVCPLEELQLHSHDENCWDENGVLICGLEEIIEHQHTEDCISLLTAEPHLICELEVHTHTENCKTNPQADLETAEMWEDTLSHVELSGQWPEDLIAIASTQIGYTESERNYLADDIENKKGYTRYGQWYGIPYGDWDAMFAAFCLHYADIPTEKIPQESNSQVWFERLQAMDMIHDQNTKVPAIGDMVFLADEYAAVDTVAIVSAVE